ncbi:MAG: lipid IV(A) 3-deoxy-D-manno-octulosonic acid transferase [Chromatiaceae bacterium]|nr:lipid IV(A) 3-deoxy-D-manno-octulosonic acid transferase [Chromatiaceae bacterium]MCP5440629.1 lipid IV(A) 3-deoxy-D-manno-octulosonic acid transferase [Chromatiaceae bacterium]
MRALYTLLLYLVFPLVLLRLLWRSIKAPAYRERWLERLGLFTPPGAWGGLWIHAVSVGEVQAVLPLIRQLLADNPGLPITVTTTTPTGSARVVEQLGEQVFHVYFPYDLPLALTGFIRRVRPRVLLMVETEIWPNLLHCCRRHGVYTLLANARLSARSAQRYARLGRFTRDTFSHIDCIAAQTEADAARFRALGVAADRVFVTGSIKFDIRIPASLEEQVEVLRREWGGRPVWVAGSTHEGEDELVLQAHHQVLSSFPNALLILVPRHPERFERVAGLCKREHLKLARRSRHGSYGTQTQVYLGDTMGELPVVIGSADVAFIGGSLVPTGGHNMLEAAAQGVAVCFGPHVFNFAAISELLVAEGAARRVGDEVELAQQVIAWFRDASARAEAGENGRRVVRQNRGALARLIGLLPLK